MAARNNGGEFQEFQSAQNQLLNIRAQQQQNLAEQRMAARSDSNTNNILAQASGIVANDSSGGVAAANFNPQTQAILNQYGLGKPTMQKSSSSQNSTQQISKQNITIHNNYKTENITTNNVTVPSGGPMQTGQVQSNTTGKLKAWISGVFAQQNETAARRDREYEIRQSKLSKESNKIMRKIEQVGVNVGKALDPRRIAKVTSDPLKMLPKILGISMIIKNWPKIMNFINTADKFVNDVSDDDKRRSKLTRLLGGKEGETPFEAFKGLIKETRDDIKESIKTGLKKRRAALKQVESGINFGIVSGDGIKTTLEKAITYLANVAKVLIDPNSITVDKAKIQQDAEEDINTQLLDANRSEYIRKNSKIIDKQEKVNVVDKNGNRFRGKDLSKGIYGDWKYSPTENISGANSIEHITAKPMIGDRNILKINDQGEPVYKGLPGYSIISTGDLSSTIGAQIAAGQEIVELFKTSNKNAINTAAIAQQLARLVKPLNENGEIIISDYFKKFFEETPVFGIKDFAEKYDKNNLLYAIDSNNHIILIDKKDKDKYDYVLEDSPANEGQQLYRVTSEGFQKILQALAGTKSYTDGNWDLTTDIKSTNVNFQNKLHNRLSGMGVRVTSFPEYQSTDNTRAFNNIMSYELERDEIDAEYQKYKQENSDRRDEAFKNIRTDIKAPKEPSTENTTPEEQTTLTTENKTSEQQTATPTEEKDPITYEDRVKRALDFFMNDKDLNLTEDQAKAFVANLIAESTLNPKAKNDEGAEGLAQWRNTKNGNRKDNILNLYNKKYSKNYKSILDIPFEEQLKMIKLELLESNDYKGFLKNLKEGAWYDKTRGFHVVPRDSVDAIARGYELGGGRGFIAPETSCGDSNGGYLKHYELRKGHYDDLTNLLNKSHTPIKTSPSKPIITPTNIEIASSPSTTFDTNKEIASAATNSYYSLDPELKRLLEQVSINTSILASGVATIDQNMVNGMTAQTNAVLQSSNQPIINITKAESYTDSYA